MTGSHFTMCKLWEAAIFAKVHLGTSKPFVCLMKTRKFHSTHAFLLNFLDRTFLLECSFTQKVSYCSAKSYPFAACTTKSSNKFSTSCGNSLIFLQNRLKQLCLSYTVLAKRYSFHFTKCLFPAECR